MRVTAVIAAGYLIGSLPIAYLVVRLLTGRDLRVLGTGNVGVMNTIHNAGLPAGMIVFLAEGAKAVSTIALGRAIAPRESGAVLCAVAALAGINWSVFLGFAGGRGSTHSTFVTLILAPWVLLASALLWIAVYGARRDNFLATRVNIVSFPLLVLLITHKWNLVALACAACLVLLLRHDRRTDDHYQLSQRQTASDR